MAVKFGRSVGCSLLIFVVVCLRKVTSERKYAVLAAESQSKKESFCIIYFTQFSALPTVKSKADFRILRDCRDKDFCYAHNLNLNSQLILLSPSNNCSLVTQARAVQDFGGAGVLFVTYSGKVDDMKVNNETEDVNITFAFISSESTTQLDKIEGVITACMFAPAGSCFDLSLLIIWIIAMISIYIGGYWSGLVRFALHASETSNLPELEREGSLDGSAELSTNRPVKVMKESSLNVSPFAMALLVMCMTLTLLLLYFFYDYLVYVLIGLFIIVSINSVYAGLYPLVMKVFPPWLKIEYRLANKMRIFDYRHFLLLAVSLTLAVCWVVTRKKSYSWALQDVLGVFFCINMLKSIRLPNLKICTVLLVLLFFYDIFFVFVTPFLTARGESVMEKVATGGQSEEKIPMVFRVPYLSSELLTLCKQQLSLGFGDVLVPGLLIAYCHGFDLLQGKARIYFHLVVFSYGIGLIVTFVALCLMSTAQPALLYLVPATVLPPIILGFIRGEFSQLWNGFKKSPTLDTANITAQNAVITTISNVDLPRSLNAAPASSVNDVGDADIKNTVEFSSERKHLL